MCPDPQILSIYVDGELPSPWKEKMEKHLAGCPKCAEKLDSFRQLRELFKKENRQHRVYVEREGTERVLTEPMSEREEMEKAKEEVWRKLKARQRFRRNYSLMKRKVSIPLPVAAAAAVVITALAFVWVYNGQSLPIHSPDGSSSIILAAEEDIPVLHVTDMSDVLQFLGSGSEVIILTLPERRLSRTGEPAIIRAADYRRSHP